MQAHIRWMIRRDLQAVVGIEKAVFEFPWCERDFVRVQRRRNVISMVIESSDHAVGFMIYELHKNHLRVLNFAVDPMFQRHGVGKTMVDRLASKLSYDRRNRIMLEVRETNVAAQLFFKACGFKAISVLRDFYDDSSEDAYLFQRRYVPTVDDVRKLECMRVY